MRWLGRAWIGTLEVRSYVAGSVDTALMVGVCDYGSVVDARNPKQILIDAKHSALRRLISARKQNQR